MVHHVLPRFQEALTFYHSRHISVRDLRLSRSPPAKRFLPGRRRSCTLCGRCRTVARNFSCLLRFPSWPSW